MQDLQAEGRWADFINTYTASDAVFRDAFVAYDGDRGASRAVGGIDDGDGLGGDEAFVTVVDVAQHLGRSRVGDIDDDNTILAFHTGDGDDGAIGESGDGYSFWLGAFVIGTGIEGGLESAVVRVVALRVAAEKFSLERQVGNEAQGIVGFFFPE